MNVPSELKYTTSHEWVRVEEGVAVVGITDFAQDQLADLTFVELPTVGDEVGAGDEVGVVESVKAASDIYAPVGGAIVEVNHSLEDQPELLNSDPYGEGWLFKVRLRDEGEVAQLLDAAAYQASMPG